MPIVHANTFNPIFNPVILVVSNVGVVIVPPPDTTVHEPLPMAAILPPIIAALLIQIVWSAPAIGAVGNEFTVICILEVEGAQAPLLISHSNKFTPKPIFVTVVVADVADVIVPLPEIKLQLPTPILGTFPLIIAVALVTQID